MMADVDLGLNRPATLNLAIYEILLVVMGEVYIGTRAAILTYITKAIMVDCCIYLVLLAILMMVFKKMKEVIVRAIKKDVEVDLKRSDTLPITMMDKVLMVIGEVYVGIKPPPLLPIIKVRLLNHWV